jgi:hypothetical protein
MPDISRAYFETLPSVTRGLLFPSLLFCGVLSLSHSSLLRYLLPSSFLYSLQSALSLEHFVYLPSRALGSLELYRFLTPFLLFPLLISPTSVVCVISFITLALYSRAIEEEHLPHPAGAARYTSALAFCVVFCLATASVSGSASFPFPYSLSLSLLFFIITYYTTFAPYSPLSFSSILMQWHSPYLLLLFFSFLLPPSLPSLFRGIVAAYLHHVATAGMKRVWGWSAWGVPDALVRLYERFGIGVRKIGFQVREGGARLGGE